MQGLTNKQKFFVGYFGAAGLLCNPWVVQALYVPDGKIEQPSKLAAIIAFQFLLFGLSFLIAKKPMLFDFFGKLKFSLNFFLSLNVLFFFFFAFELMLRTELLHNINDDKPVWIPRRYKQIEHRINLQNHNRALKNPHYFNDKIRNQKKPNGVKRIAILGDSFIWGDAVPYEKIWSRILEEKISSAYPNIEVHSWGRNGWSTLRQIEFIRDEGFLYDPDLVLIGFVANDPHIHQVERKLFTWQKNILLQPISQIFPNVYDFLVSHINAFMRIKFYPDYGYAAWESALYSDENLKGYEKVLDSLVQVTDEHNIKLGFVFTPSNNLPYYSHIFQKITPMLDKRNIPYLNLAPLVEKKYQGRNPRSLWATPSNGHPGEELTQLFAQKTYEYLLKEMDHF